MENSSKLTKILLYILSVCFMIWFGSYFIRLVITYQIIDSTSLDILKTYHELPAEFYLTLFVPVLIINIASYFLFSLAFVLFCLFSRLNLRRDGWLFIALVIFIITFPLEIYLLYLDYSAINFLPDVNSFLHTLEKRIQILSSFPIIELFLYLAVIYLFLFKPLRKIDNED